MERKKKFKNFAFYTFIGNLHTINVRDEFGRSHHDFPGTRLEAQYLIQNFCLCRSIVRCDADPGGQATSFGGHKITIFISPVCFSKGLSALDV